MKTSYHLGGFAGAWLLAMALTCAADDQIKVYTIPKAQPVASAPAIPINAAPIRWTLPAGWTQQPAVGIRRGSFAITGENGGKAEVAITSFPGLMGTELDNVNRWRGELSLEPIGPDGLKSEPVTVDSTPGKLYDLAGSTGATVVVMIQRDGNSWFIKLLGDAATVTAAKPVFLDFLKSIHFGSEAGEATALPPDAPRSTLDAPHSDDGAPKWNVPPQWIETPPRTMVFKGFAVTGEAGAKADITVSFFPGDVGGLLANVNRWRGQMGQPPIEDSQLDGVTESLATLGGKATMVDFMGADAKTGQPARLVGAIVPHGDHTWFYKLMGDAKVVGGQKDSFVQFVKTVHYP